MGNRRAQLLVKSGPNQGDTVGLELGGCRLIGRHLSDNETAFLDREGNRKLDAAAAQILSDHLQPPGEAEQVEVPSAPGGAEDEAADAAYVRGPDIIFSDDAISRAHAMVYFDNSGAVGIIDLASTNGTFVNQKRVTNAALVDGDMVSLGSSHLAVHLS